jgi:hypothetical protein
MPDAGRSQVPIAYGGAGNRLTFAEVRRALFRTTEGFFIFFGVFFGGIPAVMGAVLAVVTVKEVALERQGRPATATIVSKQISSHDDGTSYRVYYEYVAANGRTYGGDYSSDRRDYYSREKGDRFEIRYSREDPFESVVVGRRSIPIFFVFPFLSIFIIVGGALLVVGVRKLRRRLQIYGSGLEVWGKSLGIREDPSMRVNGRPCRVLEFEYVDFMGQTHVGRSAYLDQKTIARLEGKDPVPIVYLADRPEAADLDLDRLQQ